MNVVHILRKYRIPYVTQGANVSKGHVCIHCPYCGASDPSEHMTVRLSDGLCGCWRNSKHTVSLPTLLEKVANISIQDAMAACEDISKGQTAPEKRIGVPVKLPEGVLFMDNPTDPLQKLYWAYWEARTSTDPRQWDARCCLGGFFGGRIILPVLYEGHLVAFTGRTVYKNEAKRYLSSKPDEKGRVIKDYLFNFDRAVESTLKTLYVCEGPFDVIKMDELLGVGSSVGLFSCNMSSSQQDKLAFLSKYKDRIVFVLDKDARVKGYETYKKFSPFSDCTTAYHPLNTVKDPGELTLNTLISEELST